MVLFSVDTGYLVGGSLPDHTVVTENGVWDRFLGYAE